MPLEFIHDITKAVQCSPLSLSTFQYSSMQHYHIYISDSKF